MASSSSPHQQQQNQEVFEPELMPSSSSHQRNQEVFELELMPSSSSSHQLNKEVFDLELMPSSSSSHQRNQEVFDLELMPSSSSTHQRNEGVFQLDLMPSSSSSHQPNQGVFELQLMPSSSSSHQRNGGVFQLDLMPSSSSSHQQNKEVFDLELMPSSSSHQRNKEVSDLELMPSSSSSHQPNQEVFALQLMPSSSSSHPRNEGVFQLVLMPSSSSSHQQQNQEFNAFSGIEPAHKRRKVDESSTLFDVFINHRGPDVKQTLATQLYNSLEQLGIRAFLDSQEKELGNSFPSTIETAIRSAKVHIAIFSKRYAESAWCLIELVLMLRSKAKIIPVFYQVEPWELRHIEKGAYADAFIKYQEKGRHLQKLNEWKEALQSISLIAGEEFNSDRDCQKIVEAVQKEVQRKTCLHVAEYPVGLNNLVEEFERRYLNELVQDFEDHCGLEERKDKASVVGIFGMGGVGKTTLAKELFNRKKMNYNKTSFLFDVREASVRSELPSLQGQLIRDLFNEDHLSFRSTEEGKSYLTDRLRRNPHLSFLIVVDDIDHVEQLNALRLMDVLNTSPNSLVIVTTRDVGVLITAGITAGYNLKGMDRNDARELFCWHAFRQAHPYSGYEVLVNDFLDVCGGLPLSLLVLGRHVHNRAESYWRSELIKVKKTLPGDVKQSLRISFDALDAEEKQVFMDVACFFIGGLKSIAERQWERSGWNCQHALETLKDKCLVEELEIPFLPNIKGVILLRMHDHLRDLGREMAAELSPPHRLWRPQDLKSLDLMGVKTILAKANVRCFHSIFDESMGSEITFLFGQSDICVDRSACLWLKLKGNSTEQRSIPSWIYQNLHSLEIYSGQLKTLWENRMQAPSHLKELLIFHTSLKEFPDFGISGCLENGGKSSSVKAPMSGLEKLEISCENFVSKILISGIHYPSLESIRLHSMENLMDVNLTGVKTLSSLDITNCKKLKRLTGTSDLTNLMLLNINQCPDLEFEYLCFGGMKTLERITFDRNVIVKYFELDGCQNLKTIQCGCEKLVELSIRGCPEIKEMPTFKGPSCLERIIIDGCGKLEYLQLKGCHNLKSVSGNFEIRRLYISECPELEELPSLFRVTCLEEIEIKDCEKIQNITLPTTLISLSLQSCRGLQRVTGTGDLTKLTKLYIKECPELEELPILSRVSCLEDIEIKHCEKIQNITLPTTLISLYVQSCRNLQRLVGTGDLTKLTELYIFECPELEELPNLATVSCKQEIKIEDCEKIQNITLPTAVFSLYVQRCRDLQRVTGTGDFTRLSDLYVKDCPELEELPNLTTVSCMEEINIEDCEKIQNITLPTTLSSLYVERCRDLQRVTGTGDLTRLRDLYIKDCPELEELPNLATVSWMKEIRIVSCKKLQNITLPTTLISLYVRSCRDLQRVSRTGDLTRISKLCINDCPELQELPNLATVSCMEEIKIRDCEKIQNITLSTTLFSLSVQSCRDLQRVTGTGDLTRLSYLYINDCPELEELPNLATVSCMEEIKIEDCEKIQNITLPTTLTSLYVHSCRVLQRVAGTGDLTKLERLEIGMCPELEELPSLSRVSCLEEIVIDACEKLQNISGIEELHVSDYMKLCYCGNAVIRNCIHELKSVPWRGMTMIGRAVDGAESILNEYLFAEAHIGADAVTDAFSDEWIKWPDLITLIGCYVVVVDSSTSVQDINKSLDELYLYRNVKVRQGEWIIAYSWYGFYMKKVEDVLRRYGIMKEGFRLKLEKGEEWRSVGIIVDRLLY